MISKLQERQGRCRLLLPPRETDETSRLDRHVLRKVDPPDGQG